VRPLAVTSYTVVSALGAGRTATCERLRAGATGLAPNDFAPAPIDCCIGRVAGVEEVRLARELAPFDCRNNRLAALGLAQDGFTDAVARARARYGPQRVAVVVGTSTSGILATELAYRTRDPATGALPPQFDYEHTHNFGSAAEYVRLALGLAGPTLAVSTACSSSAKAFASAARLIAAGACDAAVVGGVDSLCGITLYGFSSLQLVSREPCRPFDAARAGLSIGEAAGFALLERGEHPGAPALLGYGESCDAHHMSAPHPEGLGARLAMASALTCAGLEPSAIDYIHAHGTATRGNDVIEDNAIAELFGSVAKVSSTKGATGHTLGAAGILGAAVALLALEYGFVPGTANTTALDPACRCDIQLESNARELRNALTNSFGFGGNNCSLIFGVAA
jgi:3-oxoacyl-[acyl-carrier-protein] synthase-1